MDVKELVDPEVIKQAVAGCRDSANVIFQAYYDYVYRMACYCVCEGDWAEDIAHEVYLKFTNSIALYRGEAAFSTWLYWVVDSVSTDQIRSRGRSRRLRDKYNEEREREEERRRSGAYVEPNNVISLFPAPAPSSPELDMYYQQLWDQIAVLPPKQRQAVLLVHREGLTHAEAAERMKCKESTVSGYVHEACRSLRKRLEA